jgi:tetratricopeptide (TPR) repeat protein
MSTNRPEPFAEGTFTKTPFAHILIYLMERKLTGTLEIADNKDNATIYFREGTPAKVKSSTKGKGLGQVLLDLGQINQDQLRACQQEMTARGGFAGEILMRQDALEATGLMRGLRGQILAKLVDVFVMVDARYAFYKDVNLLVGEGREELFQVDTYPVLMAGARTHGAKMKMEKVLDTVGGRWISVDSVDVLRRFRLNAPEQALCRELLSKGKTMEEIIQIGRHNRQVVRSTLYVLLLTKEAVISDVPPTIGTPSIAPGPQPRFDSFGPLSAEAISGDPEVVALRAQIREKASTIAKQNYYEMLEIPLGAPTEEIRRALFKLAKIYHPDRAGTNGTTDLRDTLQYIFSNLSEAHSTLLNPATREEYGEAISAGIKRTSLIPAAHAEKEVREALEAETLYQKGLVLLRRNRYDKALEFVDKARELNPNEGEYLATWTKIQSALRDPGAPVEDLIPHLRRAEEMAPKSERVHLYMGQLLKKANRMGEARTHFESVLEVNPRNIEAAREVRIMEIRRSKEDEKKKGFFKRFLG